MHTDARSMHIDGPARLDLVDRVLDALDRLWADTAYVPVQDRTLFALALSEVATNMVQHTADPETVALTVDVLVSRDCLDATLTDTAPPAEIDWDRVEMPEADSESGRGLALSTAALDELRHFSDERGNTWRLRRRLAAHG
jgi:serine/threonine-protein kinase RsbW